MKIFPKTFLYTLALLMLIALLANGLIYTLMPKIYIDQKQQELTEETNAFIKKLESVDNQSDIVKLMTDYAGSTQANLAVSVGNNAYSLFTWDSGIIMQSDDSAEFDTSSVTAAEAGNSKDASVTTTVVIATATDVGSATASGADINSDSQLSGTITGSAASGSGKTITEKRSFILNSEAGTLKTSVTLAPVDEAVDVIVSLLPISLLMCVLIAVVFSLLYAKAITRPIELISAETVRMTSLEKDARCDIKSKDEFGLLAKNVNGLYENLLNTIDSLEAELKKVAASEQAKTDFLRAASHELKTPATAVSVIMDNMILGIGKYKNHDEWLPKCKELVDSLSDKLRDILDTSRLEVISEQYVTESIKALCSEVLEPYLIIARAKGLSLYIDWSASFSVTAPPELLGKALSNIFSNAVQYTEQGGKFSVYCKERSLIVENECMPIPEDQLPKLYEPFFRPDVSHSRETGGNGLGLYIVETILRRIKLDYRFEPMKSPEGMRFTIYF